jgi:DNA-binding NtrC family response regulator
MGEMAKIVLIEDEEGNRLSLTRALERVGYEVQAFGTAEPALDFLRENDDVALVITDLMLPGLDGFGVLKAAREISDEIGVLMVTGHGSVESAVEAMKSGADDYLTKPVDLFELRKRTSAILEKRKLTERVNELEVRLSEKFGKLIGHTKQMEDLFRQMELVAAARANVLIIGGSGTGKELVANALHEHSPRASGRFMPINCAAIPAEILESELFGHERGAFTGATSRKVGKFELADGGTLFLDEISELPLEMQVKLLRVLEQREFMRVGGTENIKVDIRLIAATNQDLEALVDEGRFRNDLYYRLKVVTIQIPPLRDRREDIPLLARHFLEQFGRDNGREGMSFGADTLRMLISLPWEGNVRELRNLVESLVVLAPQDEIRIEDLPPEYREPSAPRARPVADDPAPAPSDGAALTMDEIERRAILHALERTGGNRTQAAEMLGIGLRTLQRKLKEYRISGKAGGR